MVLQKKLDLRKKPFEALNAIDAIDDLKALYKNGLQYNKG
jgi:hypothetical protein